MAQRKYSKEKLSSKLGVDLSEKQYNDIQKIKASSPSKATYKNIANNYLQSEYAFIKTEKDRPVNNVLDNIEEYAKRNPNIKVFIKQKGQNDFMKVSTKAALIAVAKINSDAWREGDEERESSGNYIPEIEVTEFLNSKTKVASAVYLDFNTVNYTK